MDTGWIKIHRRLLEWEWYDDTQVMRLFLHLLLRCNYVAKKWHGQVVNAGEIIVGVSLFGKEVGLTHQQTRTALAKLESTGEITIKSTNRFSLITVIKWEDYQSDNKQINKQITNKQQTNNKQITTTKECKNERMKESTNVDTEKIYKKEKFKKPLLNEAEQYAKEQQLQVDCAYFIDFYEGKGWQIGRAPMKDWKATMRNWHRRNAAEKVKTDGPQIGDPEYYN